MPMRDPESVRGRVDQALEVFLREETARLTAIHHWLAPVARQLRAAVLDGKRVRAAFCYWGWRAAGQSDSDAMIRAAAAMELVHAAAIVHDDIIDGSAKRRNGPTAHVGLGDEIGGEDGAARGVALAIVLGDLLISWAGQMFSSCGLPGPFLRRAQPLWSALATALVAGECLEILRTGSRPSTADALEVIRYKTAKYTVEHPLHIGATLGGARVGLLDTFTEYGIPLGEAFQLRDDLLGVFGDPRKTGKSNLDDLRGRKPTVLLSVTLSAARGKDRKEIGRLLNSGSDIDAADLRTIQEIMLRVGARQQIESMIADRAARAIAAIERVRLPPPAAAALTHLASVLTTRET
jgi:geranylgeranyl diphosphate synthase type I